MSITYYIYITLLVISSSYIILSVITELEFLLGKFTLPLPYGLLAWSVLGIWIIAEPYAFTIGFLIPYVSVYLLYTKILMDDHFEDLFLYRRGYISIPIYPREKGEVKVEGPRGTEFFIAETSNQSKPLPRGKEVMITAKDGNYVTVTDDFRYHIPVQQSRLHKLAQTLIHPLLPKSMKPGGTCLICFLPVETNKMLQCPYCEGVGHSDHLSHWIQARGFCPKCRSTVSFDGYRLY